jgi:hypothetical protein
MDDLEKLKDKVRENGSHGWGSSSININIKW